MHAQAPLTWTEVMEFAEAVNGTDFSGNGQPGYGICLNTNPSCKLYSYITAITAPILQMTGTQQVCGVRCFLRAVRSAGHAFEFCSGL